MTAPLPGEGALFVLPSQRVQAKIVPWRRIYDPEHWRIIPPHITLAYPFVGTDDWPALRPELAARLRHFPSFWTTLAETGAFEQPRAVLWLRPDDGGALGRIHAALAERFPAHIQDGPLGFVPHLTIGFCDSATALAQARTTLAAAWQPLRFRVTVVSYAVLEPDGIWRVRDTAHLGQARG
jgi:2'-5' RNA ligase